MAQIVKRTQDSIYVKLDADSLVTIRKRNNDVFEEVVTYDYQIAGTSYYLYEIDSDGIYKVSINENDVITDFVFPIYTNLIANISKEFNNFICNDCNSYLDDCSPCKDSNPLYSKSVKYNNLASKLLYLETSLLEGYTDAEVLNYTSFVYEALNSLGCKIENSLEKILKDECLKEISNNTYLYETIITVKYIGLFLLENNNAFNLIIDENFVGETIDVVSFSDQYLIESVKKCLCNTCLKYSELVDLFENGIIVNDQEPDNLAPIGNNFYTDIESDSSYYEKALDPALFLAVYSDDNTVAPVSVKISSGAYLTIKDGNDIDIAPNTVIPFVNLGTYKMYATIEGQPRFIDSIPFSFSDGELESGTYIMSVGFVRNFNQAPIVQQDFEKTFLDDGVTIINKNDFFNNGSVIDIEGDEITKAKIVNIQGISLEISDQLGGYVPLNIGDEIVLNDFGSFENLIRVTNIPNTKDNYFTIAFLDAGSNSYSNDVVTSNVMTASFKILNTIDLIFTGGYVSEQNTNSNWIPLGRISYGGDYTEITPTILSQGGYVDNNIALILIPAQEDSPYSIYENSGTIVQANTTNPPLNTYDVYAFTTIQSTRDITVGLEIDNVLNYQFTATILVTENEKLDEMYFLEFGEEDIADFDYLNVSANFPNDFIGTVPERVVYTDTKVFEEGKLFTITPSQVGTVNGLIGIGVSTINEISLIIYDSSGEDITSLFTKFYNSNNQLVVYISNDAYSPSTVFLRTKQA